MSVPALPEPSEKKAGALPDDACECLCHRPAVQVACLHAGCAERRAAARERLVGALMARRHACSGVAVFVDPAILRGLIDEALGP